MAGYVTVSGYKDQYNISVTTDDVTIELLIEAISDAIDAECRRQGRLWYRSITELLDLVAGGGVDTVDENQFSIAGDNSVSSKNNYKGTKYFPKNLPVSAVTKVEYKDSSGDWNTDTRNVYPYPEFVAFDTPFSAHRRQGLRLTLTVGFFEESDIPNDLKMLCNQLVRDEQQKINNNVSSFVKSKRIGGTSHSYDLSSNGQFGSGSAVFESVVAKYRQSVVYGNI